MIFRFLVCITFVVAGSAQVARTTGRICSPDQAFFSADADVLLNGPPIFTNLSEPSATPGRGAFIVMIIPTGTTASDISDALIHLFADQRSKSQTWHVPTSDDVVLLRDVALAEPSPVVSQTDYSDSRSTVSVPIPISDVMGLAGALSNINNSITSLDVQVANLNTTVNALSSTVQSLPPVPIFMDSEVPVGTINGSNTTFSISAVPSPQSSIMLTKNGMRLNQGSDYSISGTTILFATGAVPQPGDSLAATYRH